MLKFQYTGAGPFTGTRQPFAPGATQHVAPHRYEWHGFERGRCQQRSTSALKPLDQAATLLSVIKVRRPNWLVAEIIHGLECAPLKKVGSRQRFAAEAVLRGECDHCSMLEIRKKTGDVHTGSAKSLVADRTQIFNQMKCCLVRLEIRALNQTLPLAAHDLPHSQAPFPANTPAGMGHDLARVP